MSTSTPKTPKDMTPEELKVHLAKIRHRYYERRKSDPKFLGKVKQKPGPKPKYTAEELRERIKAQGLAYHHKHKRERNEIGRFRAAENSVAMPWKSIARGAINRAKERGLPYDADLVDWASLRYTGFCEITGLQFRPNRGKGCGPAPFSPSIDRIEPSLGYTKANCRFVLHALNALKGSGTEEEFEHIVRAAFFTLMGQKMKPPVPREQLEAFFPYPA